jgi:hypothetical protein
MHSPAFSHLVSGKDILIDIQQTILKLREQRSGIIQTAVRRGITEAPRRSELVFPFCFPGPWRCRRCKSHPVVYCIPLFVFQAQYRFVYKAVKDHMDNLRALEAGRPVSIAPALYEELRKKLKL